MYRVVKTFADSHDHEHVYNVGDVYPRDGLKVGKKRLDELSSKRNKSGSAFIVKEGTAEMPLETAENTESVQAGSNLSELSEAKEEPRKG